MLYAAKNLEVGTMTFTLKEEEIYVRVTDGFKQIQLSSNTIKLPSEKPTDSATTAPSIASTSPVTTPKPVPLPGPDSVMQADQPRLYMYALNTPKNGKLRGLTGADYACYKEAYYSGMHGRTFRAFLASKTQNLYSIVSDRNIPIVNKNDTIIFSSFNDLLRTGGRFNRNVKIYTFDGEDVMSSPKWPEKMVWHGADSQGNKMNDKECSDWRSDSPNRVGYAGSLNGGKLVDMHEASCRKELIVLCIEVLPKSRNKPSK